MKREMKNDLNPEMKNERGKPRYGRRKKYETRKAELFFPAKMIFFNSIFVKDRTKEDVNLVYKLNRSLKSASLVIKRKILSKWVKNPDTKEFDL